MSLDINTPKGEATKAQADRAAALFEKRHPEYQFAKTPAHRPADIDGFIHARNGGALAAIAEIKCRSMDLARFVLEFECRWLITKDKLDRGRDMAMRLGVHMTGLLYLVPDDRLLVQRIFHADGTNATDIEYRETLTQATVNGGSARRVNAFVLVKEANGRPPVTPSSHTDWLADYEREEKRLGMTR